MMSVKLQIEQTVAFLKMLIGRGLRYDPSEIYYEYEQSKTYSQQNGPNYSLNVSLWILQTVCTMEPGQPIRMAIIEDLYQLHLCLMALDENPRGLINVGGYKFDKIDVICSHEVAAGLILRGAKPFVIHQEVGWSNYRSSGLNKSAFCSLLMLPPYFQIAEKLMIEIVAESGSIRVQGIAVIIASYLFAEELREKQEILEFVSGHGIDENDLDVKALQFINWLRFVGPVVDEDSDQYFVDQFHSGELAKYFLSNQEYVEQVTCWERYQKQEPYIRPSYYYFAKLMMLCPPRMIDDYLFANLV